MKLIIGEKWFAKIDPITKDRHKFDDQIYGIVKDHYMQFRCICPGLRAETESEEHMDPGIFINIQKLIGLIHEMADNYVPKEIAACAAKRFAESAVCNTYQYEQWIKSMGTSHYTKPLSEHTRTIRRDSLFGATMGTVHIRKRITTEHSIIPDAMYTYFYTDHGCRHGCYLDAMKYVYEAFYMLGGKMDNTEWRVPIIYLQPAFMQGLRMQTGNMVITNALMNDFVNAIFTMAALNTKGELSEYGPFQTAELKGVLEDIWENIRSALYDNDVHYMLDTIREAAIMVTHYPHGH